MIMQMRDAKALVYIALYIICLGGSAMGSAKLQLNKDLISDEEIASIAQKLHDELSGRKASEEWQRSRASSLDPEAKRLMDMQNLDRESELYGAFADVKPKDEQDIDFGRGYFDPIRTLAFAYSLPASNFYHSEELAKSIRIAFMYTRKHVYTGCEKPGNWWVWGKQMPDCLCDIMALIYKDLQPEDRQYLISVINYLLGAGPLPGSGYHTGKAGKDALNFLKVGVLTSDRNRVAHAWECMENEVSPYLLETDGTPLMTVIKREFLGVSLPYIYEGYNTLVEWAQLTSGTSMALREETTGKIAQYLLGLGKWNTFQNTEVAWISFTSYRVFWYPSTVLSMAGRLASAGVEQADELKVLAENQYEEPDGCRFWPNAETLIFRSPGYYCGLVMASKPRHQISWSYKNRFLHIGSKWYYGRDGHLVIVRNSEERNPALTYTTNWRRLSGITRDDGSLLESDQIEGMDGGYWTPQWALCENPMAGAATLRDRDGVAGIELYSGETRARKSYFFLREQNMIVTLGSHISGRGSTESIVHTFPIGQREPNVNVNGEKLILGSDRSISAPCWIHAEGSGYYFPEKGSITATTETRKPDFSDVGNPPPEKQPQVSDERFVSLLFDHGESPKDANYVCAYFLRSALADMPELVEDFSSQASYIHNDVGHFLQYGNFTGVVFFRSGEIGGYRADRSCYLAVSSNESRIHLSAYEPSWQNCMLKIELPFPVAANNLPESVQLKDRELLIAVKSGHPIEFDLGME
jgi:hypothetical protein